MAAAALVQACSGEPAPAEPDAGGGGTDAGSDDVWAMRADGSVGDSAVPQRSCRVNFSLNLGRPARSVAVAGEFNRFSPTANPMTEMGGDGVFRASLDLPPGDYGYKFVVDGTQWQLDANAIARKYVDGKENSRVTV